MTYQAMLGMAGNFWSLFAHHRVFVIFDEIHHCAGHTRDTANAWGERIICEIQGRAAYTLALTGTPWRFDRVPIVLSQYCAENARIHCDYQYGLYQSIRDRVCRIPNLILIDNDNITVKELHSSERYDSFKALLEQSECSYQQLIENEALISYFVRQADKKLNMIRKTVPNAGGLIVAASVEHAHQIAKLLRATIGEVALIATYYEEDAADIIRGFKAGNRKLIISVGMISEGTNIPRLRVCCHLTRVKTELYFRQVMGRILRSSGEEDETAFFYMPAEPTLMQYAERVSEDIPVENVIKIEQMRPRGVITNSAVPSPFRAHEAVSELMVNLDPILPNSTLSANSGSQPYPSLAQSYDSALNLFGQFRQEILSLAASLSRER